MKRLKLTVTQSQIALATKLGIPCTVYLKKLVEVHIKERQLRAWYWKKKDKHRK